MQSQYVVLSCTHVFFENNDRAHSDIGGKLLKVLKGALFRNRHRSLLGLLLRLL